MSNKYNTIGIVGAGAWGTALASAFARSSTDVILWAREEEIVQQINQNQENKLFLANIKLPKNILATNNHALLEKADVILMVVPTQFTRNILNELKHKADINKMVPIILCSKGIENESGKLLSQIIEEEMPGHKIGILSGPSFADEVANGLPASLNIASENTEIRTKLIESAKNTNLSLYPIEDIISVQIAGALKNIYAIGCGIANGIGLGNNFHAAFITHALKEIAVLSKALGGSEKSILELCGIGDMILTCSSNQSRNFAFGYKIAKGEKPEDLIGKGAKVVEGAATALSMNILCHKLDIRLPLCERIYGIIYLLAKPASISVFNVQNGY